MPTGSERVELIFGSKDEVSGTVDGIINRLKGLALAYVSVEGAKRAFKLAEHAATVSDASKAYANLAKSAGVDASAAMAKMKEATAGTVSEFKLMQQFSQAAMLGLPLDRFDEMLQIARGAAAATGQSMEFMLNSIVTGIGRQSKLMLDNLGILVDIDKAYADYARTLGKAASELTEVERKQAFTNAALNIGMRNLNAAGGAAELATDSFNRARVATEELQIAFGDALQEEMSAVADLWARLASSATEYAKARAEIARNPTDPNRPRTSRERMLPSDVGLVGNGPMLRQIEDAGFIGPRLDPGSDPALEYWRQRNKEAESLLALWTKYRELGAEPAMPTTAPISLDDVVQMDELDALYDDALSETARFFDEKFVLEKMDIDRQKERQAAIEDIFEQHSEMYDSELERLDQWYASQLAIIGENEEARTALEELYAGQRMEIANAEAQAKLGALGDLFGGLAALAKSAGKENFGFYKAMAVAESYIAMFAGIQKAIGAYPPPFNFVAAASVAAYSLANIGRIAAMRPPSAHGGLESVPETSTYVLRQGERVLAPQQNRDLTEFLSGGGAGGATFESGAVQISVSGSNPREVDSMVREQVIPALERAVRDGLVNFSRKQLVSA